MALFQPSNITPSTLSGTGTIDALQDMAVTWQINGTGGTPMTDFEIAVYQNDEESTQLYTTGQIHLTEPFYGTDRMGNPNYFTATITAAELAGAGITNGNEYKFLITQWWTAADSITQTSANVFITRETPTIAIGGISGGVTTLAHTFTGEYAQAQGDAVEWAEWRIGANGNAANLLLDTGRIYNAGVLEVSYDGFVSGNSYMIRLNGQTVNGVEFDTGWQVFTVTYAQTEISGAARACSRCDTDAVQIDFPYPMVTEGAGAGNWSVTQDDTLSLPAESDSATWNEADGGDMALTAPYGIAWKGTIGAVDAQGSTLFAAATNNNAVSLNVSSTEITAQGGGEVLFSVSGTFASGDVIKAVLQPAAYTLYQNGTQIASGVITATQETITSAALFGPQECEYLWISRGAFTAAQLALIADDAPAYDGGTYLLADFTDGLMAGAIRTQEEITGIIVYRQEEGGSALQKCATLGLGGGAFRDYAAANGKTYTYYVYGATANGTSTAVVTSNSVSPLFWHYTLLTAQQNDNGDYVVQDEYRFALDVDSGTTSNNNSPQLQQNFTRYPLRQPTSQNYRSAVLTSYVAKVKNGRFVDSLSRIDALREISTSGLTKFLKTRKGEIMRVETGGPISISYGDQYAQQPAKSGIPWVEVGSAEGLNIITAPGDAYWTVE